MKKRGKEKATSCKNEGKKRRHRGLAAGGKQNAEERSMKMSGYCRNVLKC